MKKFAIYITIIATMLFTTFAFAYASVGGETVEGSIGVTDEKEVLDIVYNVLTEINEEFPPEIEANWASGDQGDTNFGTHGYIASRGAHIVKNVNGTMTSYLTASRISSIVKGSVLPDKDETTDAFAGHFYGENGKNYLGGDMTAYWNFNRHYKQAVSLFKSGSTSASLVELGRALHYINDIAMPHHSMNKIAGVSRHTQFEKYVEGKFSSYALGSVSTTTLNSYTSKSTKSIADSTATLARNNYTNANSTDTAKMNTAASNTMKRAQTDAAGVIYKFFEGVGKI